MKFAFFLKNRDYFYLAAFPYLETVVGPIIFL